MKLSDESQTVDKVFGWIFKSSTTFKGKIREKPHFPIVGGHPLEGRGGMSPFKIYRLLLWSHISSTLMFVSFDFI